MSWTVASVMTPDVVTIGPSRPYKEVAELLRALRVSAPSDLLAGRKPKVSTYEPVL